MEDQAHNIDPRYGNHHIAPTRHNMQDDTRPHLGSSYNSSEYTPRISSSSTPPQRHDELGLPDSTSYFGSTINIASNINGLAELPNFSPFPPLRNPGPNIPPTDEQKERVLEQAREAVLGCNDPEQQLTWAQDVLSYCEIAQQNEARLSRTQPARPRTPRVEHALKVDAMKIVNFLADQNHPKAQFMRGLWYEFGKFGYPLDKPESYHCYKRASERGYIRAWYRMGMQFESGNDPLTAIKYYRMASDAGDSAACYRLGMMTLLSQHGQQQNYEHGLQLIYTAAHTADDNAPQGVYVLGMLQAGELSQVKVPEQYLRRNIQEAKINLERAAFLGFAKAQVRMGAAYELAELNCDFDPALSLHYNALAARQGEVEAEMAISKWFLCGYEGLFEKNEELAFTYAQRAAVDGLPTAQFAVGYFYEVGIYVKMDLKEAKEWYRKAEENGNKDAVKRIEAVSRSKTISRKDHDNVSVARIRQQHGQYHHHERISTAPGMSVASPHLYMPDPSRLNLNPAPYPTESSGPQLQSNSFRPASAFGINPNLRAPSATGGPIQQDRYTPGVPPQRPYPSTAQDPYSRRVPSSGSGLSPYPQVAPGVQSSRHSPRLSPQPQPGPPYQGRPQHNQRPQQQQQRLGPPQHSHTLPASSGNHNLGFTAPVDAEGADRPDWHPHMSGSGEGPRPARQYQQGPPTQINRPPRTSSQPGGQQHPHGPQAPQLARPPQNIQPVNARPTKPAANSTPSPKPQSRPAQVSAASAASRPPGKGPKTFQEMGIPQQSDEKDCVSRTHPPICMRLTDPCQGCYVTTAVS